MTQYDNSNSGIVFKNDRKETETHPDSKGSGEVTCTNCGSAVPFWISAWRRVTAKGNALSMKFQAKEAASPVAQKQAPASVDFDEDVPF